VTEKQRSCSEGGFWRRVLEQGEEFGRWIGDLGCRRWWIRDLDMGGAPRWTMIDRPSLGITFCTVESTMKSNGSAAGAAAPRVAGFRSVQGR
jgi:hypothetical protein